MARDNNGLGQIVAKFGLRPECRPNDDGRTDVNVAIRVSIFATATLLSLNLSGSGQSQQANMTCHHEVKAGA
jgi:hypothetical protein